MRFLEELLGNLAKVVDETDGGVLLERIGDAVDVDVAFVEEVVKDVDGLEGGLALLFEAEDEVDPLVEMRRDEVALQRLAVSADELARIAFGPRRQENVVQRGPALFYAQIEPAKGKWTGRRESVIHT